MGRQIKQKDLTYKTSKYRYDFQQCDIVKMWNHKIFWWKFVKLLQIKRKRKNKRTKEGKYKKRDIYESVYALYEERQLTANAFKSEIFPIKSTQGKGLKILSLKQML